MTATARADSFLTANPHALGLILQASETRSILASRDIFDISGIKLWARDQPVSQALQRKLLDRQLRSPLETCLMAEGGVTATSLVDATEALLASGTPLAGLLRPHAARLIIEVKNLPLQPVAQLLLSVGQTARPESFDHAVQAMALAGQMMIAHGGTTAEVRLAMLGGLLHDIGEMYIDPRFGESDADWSLDFVSYQQLVVHPHVGHLLLTQLTQYPVALARGVAEHHERLDGSGYPQALRRDALSPLGRLLAVAEAALNTLRHDPGNLARASVALRVVPGEFDMDWVTEVAKVATIQGPPEDGLDLVVVQLRLERLDDALRRAQDHATALESRSEPGTLRETLALAQFLIGRLRAGWFASGLWSGAAVTSQDAAEVEAIEDELFFRLRAIERAVLLRAGDLPEVDAASLSGLCEALRASGI